MFLSLLKNYYYFLYYAVLPHFIFPFYSIISYSSQFWMNVCEIFRFRLFLHFQYTPYLSFIFFLHPRRRHRYCFIIGVHQRLWFTIRGPIRRPAGLSTGSLSIGPDRLYTCNTFWLLYIHCCSKWDRVVLQDPGQEHHLRGGEGGENGPTERARRGNCAPTSGSPVAPSRTCRLFPRRDSRSPHLSSVRPASPKTPSFPRSVFDPLTTDGTRVHRGYRVGGRTCLFIFRYFRSATREIHFTCT